MTVAPLEYTGLVLGHGRRPLDLAPLEGRVEQGECVALWGRNGSGKSTLLRTLAGLQRPLAGEVRLGGRLLAALSPEETARRVGIVLTHRPETGMLGVRDVVALGLMPWGVEAGGAERVEEALGRTGCSHLADRRFATLSDGEAARVMVARALAQRVPLLLLDEPTAFLDHEARRALMLLLRRLALDERKAILLSSHDGELVETFCTRRVVLAPPAGRDVEE